MWGRADRIFAALFVQAQVAQRCQGAGDARDGGLGQARDGDQFLIAQGMADLERGQDFEPLGQ